MIFSSLACLFSLCTQVLFTLIKDGKINNNTMQTGTCKIPTEGMTVPRPVAPALPPHPLSFCHCTSFLPHPNPYCALSATKHPQPPVAFLQSGKTKSKFPQQDRQRETGGKRRTGMASPSCPARGAAAVPALVHPSGHGSHHLIFSLALIPLCRDFWKDGAT